MDSQPTLQTERLQLRPLELSDAPRVQELAGERAVAATTTNIPHPYEKGMAERWITIHRQHFARAELATFAVTLLQDGAFIGAVTLHFDNEHERAELGYWIGLPYWGNGYCTEAARAVVRYGFEQRALQRISSCHFGDNRRSERVLLKLGFTHEGCQRQHIKKWDEFHDLHRYGILRSEYEAFNTSSSYNS
jgi:[ribosomal protein S5]-alanine N-acetyltransferase